MQFITKKAYVYKQLKEAITSGKLKPGDKIVIRDLAEKYNVSQIPVREAISELYHEGLVHTIPYTGTYVAKMDVQKIFETTAVRNEVEALCLKTAMPFITADDIAKLRDIVKNLYLLYGENSLSEYIVLNHSFYLAIYEKSPYQHMNDYRQDLFQLSRTNTSLIAPHAIPDSLKMHDELIDLIEKGDVNGAIACFHLQKRHAIRSATKVMREFLLHPDKREGSFVNSFYQNENIDKNLDTLLEQLNYLDVLFPLD